MRNQHQQCINSLNVEDVFKLGWMTWPWFYQYELLPQKVKSFFVAFKIKSSLVWHEAHFKGNNISSSLWNVNVRAAATEKARSPIVGRAVAGTISAEVTAERSRRRDSTSATWWRSSARYCVWQRYLKIVSRNVIRSGICNQSRSCSSGVTRSNFLVRYFRSTSRLSQTCSSRGLCLL